MFLCSYVAFYRNFTDLIKNLSPFKKSDKVPTDFIQDCKIKHDIKKHLVPKTVENVEICTNFKKGTYM